MSKKINKNNQYNNKSKKCSIKNIMNENYIPQIKNINSKEKMNGIILKNINNDIDNQKIHRMKTSIDKETNGNIFNRKNFLINLNEELQDINYEKAIIFDKRNYFRMFFAFLEDKQIIFETFFTENYLYLFIIKFSFFIYNLQISFFLNTLFYTDEYISNAYYNNGVLDFISGLPKSIYASIVTLMTTNLLRILSNNKDELKRIIKNKRNVMKYKDLINIKLKKLKYKLIAYFIIIFILSVFFSYYVTSFCSVYRYSQKYLIYGFIESFVIDFLISIIISLFLSLLRFISIKKKVKCLYLTANVISIFF